MVALISRDHDIYKFQTKDSGDPNDYKGKIFQIRKWGAKSSLGLLQFLMKRNLTWSSLPGFETMLYAYKLINKRPQLGPDNFDLIKDTHNLCFDESQKNALAAVLNLNRPIVAVHGPSGSGKSRILLECLRIFSEQRRKIYFQSTISNLYMMMQEYCKLTGKTNFVIFLGYDAILAQKIIECPKIREAIKERSVQTDVKHRNAKQFFANDDIQIYCSKGSNSLLSTFVKEGLSFDVTLLDDANQLNEFNTWQILLQTSPSVRLFGDWKLLENTIMTIETDIARQEQLDISLIRRLDEKFGQEINFKLTRQYRSNHLIHAWLNRVFYREKAAESDEFVRDLHLNDLIQPQH